MFHDVFSIEYVLKMKKYTNAHYSAGIFVNFSIFIGCALVGLMRAIYLKIFRVEASVAVGSEYCFLEKKHIYNSGSCRKKNGLTLHMANILPPCCDLLEQTLPTFRHAKN